MRHPRITRYLPSYVHTSDLTPFVRQKNCSLANYSRLPALDPWKMSKFVICRNNSALRPKRSPFRPRYGILKSSPEQSVAVPRAWKTSMDSLSVIWEGHGAAWILPEDLRLAALGRLTEDPWRMNSAPAFTGQPSQTKSLSCLGRLWHKLSGSAS